jgi:hypothetical protein
MAKSEPIHIPKPDYPKPVWLVKPTEELYDGPPKKKT